MSIQVTDVVEIPVASFPIFNPGTCIGFQFTVSFEVGFKLRPKCKSFPTLSTTLLFGIMFVHMVLQ